MKLTPEFNNLYISFEAVETDQPTIVDVIFYLLENIEDHPPKIWGSVKITSQRTAVANVIYQNLPDISNNLFMNAYQRHINSQTPDPEEPVEST